MDMDQLVAFVQERWFVIVLAIIALVIVVKIVKTVLKWVIVLAIIAAVVFYGAGYKEQLADIGASVLEVGKEQSTKAIIKMLEGEAAEAKYEQEADGTFKITTENTVLTGKVGSNEVKLTIKGQTFTLQMNDIIKAVIEQAKKN